MFDQHELQTLIGGAETPIDVDDLQRHSAMHDKDDPLNDVFWKVVKGFTQPELRALLKFVTSTPNPPLSVPFFHSWVLCFCALLIRDSFQTRVQVFEPMLWNPFEPSWTRHYTTTYGR